MIDEALITVIAHYDVGQVRQHQRIHHGWVNDHWRVETAGGQYFLKRRHNSLSKPRLIEAQHQLIQHLCDAGFPAPQPVPTRHGPPYLDLDDEIYELYPYIAGALCDVRRPAHWAAAVRTLARYHQTVAVFDHPALHWPDERYGPTALAGIVGRLRQAWRGRTDEGLDALVARLVAHADDLRERFAAYAELPALIIHGDYHAGNLILQGDTVVGVVDFDLAHRCWRAMEVAEALIFFATQRTRRLEHVVYAGVLDLQAVGRFIETYSAASALSRAELEALPHLVRTIWLCAALDPPLEPLLSLDRAPQALPEVLVLADWARAHAGDIVGIGMAAHA
jgi:homoserine kinase type II